MKIEVSDEFMDRVAKAIMTIIGDDSDIVEITWNRENNMFDHKYGDGTVHGTSLGGLLNYIIELARESTRNGEQDNQ